MNTKIELPDISKQVAVLLKQRGSSIRELSLRMGYSHSYLFNALKRKNLPIGLLMELSSTLGVNLLEAYLHLLPPHVRPTAMERDLMQKMSDQTTELQRITEERDRYWKVIETKGG